jgi:hypothetical protein
MLVERGPAEQRLLVHHTGGCLGELDVSPRAWQSGLLEQVRLDVVQRAEERDVVVDL